jgi:hypothetical protein
MDVMVPRHLMPQQQSTYCFTYIAGEDMVLA